MQGMSGAVLVAVMMAATLAGCMDADAPVSPPGAAETSLYPVSFEGSGCSISAVAMLRSFAETAPWLPPGLHARDAGQFVTPGEDAVQANLQRSAFVVFTWACDETDLVGGPTSFVSVSVFVQPPAESAAMQEGWLDFYEIERYVPDDAHAHQLAGMGWSTGTLARATLSSAFSQAIDLPAVEYRPHPTHLSAEALVAGDGLLFSATAAGMAHYLVGDRVVRFWHVLDGGHMGLMEIVPTDNGSGGSATCQVGSESRLAEIVGAQACVDGSTLAGSFPDIGWRGNFTTMTRATP